MDFEVILNGLDEFVCKHFVDFRGLWVELPCGLPLTSGGNLSRVPGDVPGLAYFHSASPRLASLFPHVFSISIFKSFSDCLLGP